MTIQKVKEWKESKRAQFKVVDQVENKIISVIRLKDKQFFSLGTYETAFRFNKEEIPSLHDSVYVALQVGTFFKDLINVSLFYTVLDVTGVNVLGDTHFLFDICPINEIEKHKKAFKDFDFISFLKRESSKINKNYAFMQSN